jgi:metal-responsive CopG/Arc/MetJ family transcriptional regulator
MVQHKSSKVTISLPRALLELADRLAEERSTTRSAVIAELLWKEERTQTELVMAEGYRQLADENRRESEEALNLTSEVILRDG